MGKVQMLDKEISELIAAGEVIERPASVVKELVENAVDAGARHIAVEIRRGGISYIRVTDDGSGMAPDDVPTAFLRHATSKISTKEDLNRIHTLGFRGEALASIAAVSKVTVRTRREQDAMGTSFVIQGGEPGETESTGCPVGTTIVVQDLFYNVPVRAKFLKKDVTEANSVSQIVRKIALSHPEIGFRMTRDGRVEFHTDGSGDLYAAIYAVCGKEFAHDMVPVDYTDRDCRVHGYTVKPLYAKANRTQQYFFVNGRSVYAKLCSVALENAYQNLIMVGKFPTCVLSLEVPPDQVDVNMHPTKAEVRFTHEKEVMDCLYFGVKNALLQSGLLYDFEIKAPEHRDDWTTPPEQTYQSAPLSTEPVRDTATPLQAAPTQTIATAPSPVSYTAPTPEPAPVEASRQEETTEDLRSSWTEPADTPEPATVSVETDVPQAPVTPPVSTAEPTEASPQQLGKLRVLGEIFYTYILAECDDPEQLVIMDKHAAHERVRFEQLRSGEAKQTSQYLLEPASLEVSMEEFSAVQENTDKLEEMGFTVDCSTPPTLVLRAVPSFVMEMDLRDVIAEIAHNLALGKRDPSLQSFQTLCNTIACKSAIRAGDHSSLEELQHLADTVWSHEEIRHCPHGRPIVFVIRKTDLEKQFRRIV